MHSLTVGKHGKNIPTGGKDTPLFSSATGDDEEQKKQKKQPSIPLIEIGVAPSLG